MSDKQTLRLYGEMAGDYARMTRDAASDPALADFIAALPRGAQVLDLGCGPGFAAAVMARTGMRVTATDAVPEMVARAAAHPGVTAHLASFDEIAGRALYHGVWANFSLLHAPRAALPRHLRAIRLALRPGGLFHIGMKTGAGSARDRLGRLYTYVTEAELRSLLREAGFSPGRARHGRVPGLDGVPADWVTILSVAGAQGP